MENRGSPVDERPSNRPAISRRSCDQCRARKIGCDRGTPCSNCLSARVDCTHSRIAPRSTIARQRASVSEQYERKIDDIARDISSIKSLLELDASRRTTAQSTQAQHHILSEQTVVENSQSPTPQTASSAAPLPHWEHSSHIIDFVKSVARESDPSQASPEYSHIASSLKSLANVLERPQVTQTLPRAEQVVNHPSKEIPTPPLEAIVKILRWAKAHSTDYRIIWICKFLPLDMFQKICTKVYFGVDDHTEAEFIIANSFLSYVFAEHAVVYGDAKHSEYCRFYRSRLGSALSKLPLLLPASLELTVALTLGALYSVEECRALQAWTLISTAMTFCQTLGYHRLDTSKGSSALHDTETRLFWAVITYENSLSLRLGRCSSIQESDITLPIEPNQHRSIQVGRIQGKVYDHLYSPNGLSLTSDKRDEIAQSLAQELQSLMDETQDEVAVALSHSRGIEEDPMKVIYLHCDLVCQSSLLAMILRAIPRPRNTDVSDSCVTVARNTLDLHEQCMKLVNGCKDPLLIRRYINWAILHTPFVPFSIVFTHAVQHFDVGDMDRLDRFAASFKPETSSPEPLSHPYRLYELLCQAARFYIKSRSTPLYTSGAPSTSSDLTMPDIELTNFMSDMGVKNATFGGDYGSSFDIGDWFHSNQQFMGLLHEDVPY